MIKRPPFLIFVSQRFDATEIAPNANSVFKRFLEIYARLTEEALKARKTSDLMSKSISLKERLGI